MQVEIRDAIEADLAEITAIYNEVLTSSTAIYNDIPSTREERLAWWQARRSQGYPVLVACEEGMVAGFATFGDFRSWPGYRFTVEGTIHIRGKSRGHGVGRSLLTELLKRAAALGKHMMVAGVDSENQASLRFLEGFGFKRAGYLREVGYKFNRFLDLVFLQFAISEPARGSSET